MAKLTIDDAGLAEECTRRTGINQSGDDKESCGNDETEILTTERSGNPIHPETTYGTLRLEMEERDSVRKKRSKSTIDFLSNNETELRTSVFHHTSNPIIRWNIDHNPPVKMVVQLLKSICLVTQVVLMMHSPINKYPAFQLEAQDVFANFLLLPSRLPAIPLVRGFPYNTYTFHAYTTADLEFTMNNAGSLFYQNLSLLGGTYDFVYDAVGSPKLIEVTLMQYSQATLKPANKTFSFNAAKNTTYFNLIPEGGGHGTMFEQLLDVCGKDSCFQRLIEMDIKFFLSNIRVIHSSLIHCFLVTVKLSVVPQGGGRFLYTLTADSQCVECINGTLSYDSESWNIVNSFEIVLDSIVVMFCFASTFLTIKVIKKSYILAKAMGLFYHTHLGRSLKYSDQIHLFQYWHLINISSDIVIMTGTLLKVAYSWNYTCNLLSPSSVESVRVLLGIGVVLQAAVILRYTSYFQQFNALSSALNIAFPRLLKFLACVGILYLAFMLCGWVTLEPFHYKFSNYDASFYTLFAMLNGDDLWNTYTGMNQYDNSSVFIFSQVFITIFLILFIYAVLNLFVSLIIQSYDESRRQDPHLRNEVQKFVYSSPLTSGGKALKDILPAEFSADLGETVPVPEVVVHNPIPTHRTQAQS